MHRTIFTIPLIRVAEIFLDTTFRRKNQRFHAVLQHFSESQRCSSTASRSVRSVAAVACVGVLLHAVAVGVRVLRVVVLYYAPRLA